MASPEWTGGRAAEEGLREARLNAALARIVTRICGRYVGRGPSKATAFVHQRVVVIVMEDAMTTAERSLIAAGGGAVVSEMRRDLERAMELELTEAVMRLTGCGVRALMSGWSHQPDMACQVYALDGPVAALSR